MVTMVRFLLEWRGIVRERIVLPMVEVAQDCYAPIDLSLAVIKGRDANAATQAFIDFIATPQARQVMEHHGL